MHEQIPFEIGGEKGVLQRSDTWWPPTSWHIYSNRYYCGSLLYQQSEWRLSNSDFEPFKDELALHVELWVESHPAGGAMEYDLSKPPFTVDPMSIVSWEATGNTPQWYLDRLKQIEQWRK